MSDKPTTAELDAYLDEALPPDRMAVIEQALRADPELTAKLGEINSQRDAGVHSLGEVWRRRRLTCPTREQLGSYALDVLPEDFADYVRFHIETVGCRLCSASLEDLRARDSESDDDSRRRSKRYFQSSVGRLSSGH